MTIKEVQKIIKDFENSELTILELEYKDIKLKLSKNKPTELVYKNNLNEENKIDNKVVVEPKVYLPEEEIKSPLVGTFYAANDPQSEPFVKVGDVVKQGDALCIIEAMKIMNEITAPHDGVIEKIHFTNGEAVGFDDLLFTVRLNGTTK